MAEESEKTTLPLDATATVGQSAPRTAPAEDVVETAPEWRPGDVIDDIYRVEAVIARGGMGVVYRALDLATGQTVVIKSLLSHVAEHTEYKDRFLREAEEWVRLGGHPNIVRAITVVEARFIPHLILEFVQGGSLHDLLRAEGRLLPHRLLPLAVDIARGMAFAQDKGLVHRDLKPANILIGDRGALVTDFGLVKRDADETPASDAAARDLPEATLLTQGAMGTPEYMSPEQWRGDSAPSTDIYAFGILMYECATGRLPFRFAGLKGAERLSTYRTAHCTTPPPALETVTEGIPGAISGMILRCLEKSPAARYASFHDIEAALSQAAQTLGMTIAKLPDAESRKADSEIDRAQAYIRLGLCCSFQGKTDKAETLLSDAHAILRHHPEHPMFVALLLNLSHLRSRQGRMPEAVELIDDALSKVTSECPPALVSGLWNQKGILEEIRGNLAASMDAYETGYKIAETETDSYYAKARILANMAVVHSKLGHHDVSETSYRKVIDIAKENADWNIYCTTSLNLGVTLRNKGDIEEATLLVHEALKYSEKIGKQSTAGMAHINLGNLLKDKRDYEGALHHLHMAQAIFTKSTFAEGLMISEVNLASLHNDMKNHQKALKFGRNALRIAEKQGHKDGIARTLSVIAATLLLLHRADEALPEVERAVALVHDSRQPLTLFELYLVRGKIQVALGNLDAAQEDADRSEACLNSLPNPACADLVRDLRDTLRKAREADSAR